MDHKQPHQDKVFIGIFFGVLAFFGFAVMSMGAKLLSDTHSVFEISFYRCLITLVPMGAYVLWSKRYALISVYNKKLVFLRVILGILAVLSTFGTAKYLPLADATLLFMMASWPHWCIPYLTAIWRASNSRHCSGYFLSLYALHRTSLVAHIKKRKQLRPDILLRARRHHFARAVYAIQSHRV